MPRHTSSSLDLALIQGLRDGLLQGCKLAELVDLLRSWPGRREMNTLMVMNYFMRAFDLRFLQVRHMPGAACMGGQIYADQDVEDMLRQHIDLKHVDRLRCMSSLPEVTTASARTVLSLNGVNRHELSNQ